MRLIVAQEGKPNAAPVIARSIAEPDSKSKNAKTWPIPNRDPRHTPRLTLLTAEQRKTLAAAPQSRPRIARRMIGFTGERSLPRFSPPLLLIPLTTLAPSK